MRTPDWTPITLPSNDGFDITLSFEPEDHVGSRRHFIEECGWTAEEYKSIANYYWFCAKVTASRGGVKLGSAYLGGCCHSSKEDAKDLGGCLPHMIEEAVFEAKESLPILIEQTKALLARIEAV